MKIITFWYDQYDHVFLVRSQKPAVFTQNSYKSYPEYIHCHFRSYPHRICNTRPLVSPIRPK